MTPPLTPSEHTKLHAIAPEWCTGCLVENNRRHCAEHADSGEAPCSGRTAAEWLKAMMAAIDTAAEAAAEWTGPYEEEAPIYTRPEDEV